MMSPYKSCCCRRKRSTSERSFCISGSSEDKGKSSVLLQTGTHTVEDRICHVEFRHPGETFFFSAGLDDRHDVGIGSDPGSLVVQAVEDDEVGVLLFQFFPCVLELVFGLKCESDQHAAVSFLSQVF